MLHTTLCICICMRSMTALYMACLQVACMRHVLCMHYMCVNGFIDCHCENELNIRKTHTLPWRVLSARAWGGGDLATALIICCVDSGVAQMHG